MAELLILLAGIAAGGVFGLFGAGGSAFATPMLALAGVPGAIAIATPLPALLPASVVSARRQLRTGNLDKRVATLVIVGGVPGAIVGALASSQVTGRVLLTASGALLAVIGARVLLPDPDGHAERALARRGRMWVILVPAFAVGLLSGLLANSGGFLLVPLCILLLGLTAARAAGTSIVAAGVLSLPTLLVHWELGHIDWAIAVVFSVGMLPGSLAGARLSERIPADQSRRLFGVALVAFAAYFLLRLS